MNSSSTIEYVRQSRTLALFRATQETHETVSPRGSCTGEVRSYQSLGVSDLCLQLRHLLFSKVQHSRSSGPTPRQELLCQVPPSSKPYLLFQLSDLWIGHRLRAWSLHVHIGMFLALGDQIHLALHAQPLAGLQVHTKQTLEVNLNAFIAVVLCCASFSRHVVWQEWSANEARSVFFLFRRR